MRYLVNLSRFVINPGGEVKGKCLSEGCMSVPLLYAPVKRAAWVHAKGLDREAILLSIKLMVTCPVVFSMKSII